MNKLLLSLLITLTSVGLISCMSTEEKSMSNYCLSFPENRASFFKYSNCMSQLRNTSAVSTSTNPSSTNSNDFYSKSLEQKLSDAERRNSQLIREQKARDNQIFTDKLNQDSKKTYDDRMKWKPGDK